MGKIRTLKDAIEEFKVKDPNCALTYSALRKMVLDDKVPYTKVGVKYLVDTDLILETLFNSKEVVSNEYKQA